MNIVVLDGHALNPGDLSWEPFRRLGSLVVHDRTQEGERATRMQGADAILTNKTPITAALLDAAPSIRYIGVLATGYNVVDIDAARARGVVVTNIPGYSTASVAQFVFALLLEMCHHVGHHAETVRDGRWITSPDFCYWDFPLVELQGKTMGLVGFGQIGRAVANIAVAFGMKVLVYNRSVNPGLETEHIRYAGLDEVFARADIISLHVPLADTTKGMIDAAAIAAMRDGVFLINTARGPLVVEADVAAALESGKLGGYAADVVDVEPMAASNPLRLARNCILTPHIAWAPQAARQRAMDIAFDNLSAFASGSPIHVVG